MARQHGKFTLRARYDHLARLLGQQQALGRDELELERFCHLLVSSPGAEPLLALVGAAALGVDLFRALQLGAAKRAEEYRIVDGIGLVLMAIEAEQPHRHIKHAIVVDRDQRLKVLTLHRIFQAFTAFAEIAACTLRHHCPLPLISWVMPPRRAAPPWRPLPRSCQPYRTPAPVDDRSHRRTDP